MPTLTLSRWVLASVFVVASSAAAGAQIVEAVGSRALGMGGAFVAVANDSSATWWNPAGLADGPFLDIALARAVTGQADTLPGWRDRTAWFALATPPFGVSYYHLRSTSVPPFDPTVSGPANRESEGAGVPVRSWSASQIGATVVHSLLPGVHLGSTIKYVRGTYRTGRQDARFEPVDLLEVGEDLAGGEAEQRFDFDVGVLTTAGPVRLGGVVRNATGPEFGGGAYRLPRQVRVGAALDVEHVGGPALMLAVDADVRRYLSGAGERKVVAVGAEQWLSAHRVGVRAGARMNTVGLKERGVTGGVSVALRSAMYLDAHVVRGGTADQRGWGVAARVSF